MEISASIIRMSCMSVGIIIQIIQIQNWTSYICPQRYHFLYWYNIDIKDDFILCRLEKKQVCAFANAFKKKLSIFGGHPLRLLFTTTRSTTYSYFSLFDWNHFYLRNVRGPLTKITQVIPIHKKGEFNNTDSYRPTFILPVISKIFEIVLKNNLLINAQFGYRQRRSTIDAICEMNENIIGTFEERKLCTANFYNMSKAFDTVNHGVLIQKLEYYGVRGKALNLFTFYLANQQCIRFNGNVLKLASINYGVPQGSALGPLLFIIYCYVFYLFLSLSNWKEFGLMLSA